MAGKLDQVLVIDIESTCWEGPPPPGEEKEIIEIGICALDVATGERVSRQSILVKPEHSQISEFCTELTHLTPSNIEREGVTFGRACAILRRKYAARDRIWASYGDYDRRQFEQQCAERQVLYPFGSSHINVKTLFALFNGMSQEIGLLNALNMMHLPVEGTHHRGVDDAWNTAQLLWMMMHGCRVERDLAPANLVGVSDETR
ncbi:MAG TPA: 3'-5' exonuclease [Aggregatilinea sp.]|uniref:3'-5' exonuclease n=1 Tax=Aggregatilinea sp. TaxID=2806333 RepID=UPI002B9A24C2|nr:3'-5' exonuclease [Aggregatilinea sp.]HML22872.1 3'-5' exonuclease [Aggregatilinea sp.]